MAGKNRIIYINFAPYENAGNILDFLKANFDSVLLFTFNFHRLGNNQSPSKLILYKRGTIVLTRKLFQSPTDPRFAFVLLPLRSVILFLQILFHSYDLRKTAGPYDAYFTVNAFTAWTGLVLKQFHLVKKTIFWVWDYYPPHHKDRMITFMRWMYWLFDRPASILSDRTIFLNPRMYALRKKIGVIPLHGHPTVSIGTNPIRIVPRKTLPIKLIFIGVIKKSQGLDIIFDAGEILTKLFPGISLSVIGGGPDKEYFLERARDSGLTTQFFGYMDDPERMRKIVSNCHIGIAPYVPEKGNVSYYSDPSKVKDYLSSGLPVITTGVFQFSDEIARTRSGLVIPYDKGKFIHAVSIIAASYPQYARRARAQSKRYDYKKLYKLLFAYEENK